MINILKSNWEHDCTIIQSDILKFDFKTINSNNIILFGNLPYNISSKIIKHLIASHELFKEIIIMVQWEFGKRLEATQGKHYGLLSIMVQKYFQVQYVSKVPSQAFYPIPKVDSCILRLTNKKENHGILNEQLFDSLTHSAFSQRRKKIRNSLKHYRTLSKYIDLNLRPEEINLESFIQLSNTLHHEN